MREEYNDYISVYEYDFRKLTNIWEDIQFVKNSLDKIESLFNDIETLRPFAHKLQKVLKKR